MLLAIYNIFTVGLYTFPDILFVLQENALDNAALEQSVFIDHVEQKSVNHLALPPPLPTHPRLLTNEEYPGPYNFEVDLDPNGTKNPWIVSVN